MIKRIPPSLESLCKGMTNGIRIGSSCKWSKHGEKSKNLFLSLERHCATKNKIRGIIFENKEIINHIKYN